MSEFQIQSVQHFMLYYILPIVLPFVIAYAIHRLSDRLARQIVPIGQLARHRNTHEHRQARRQTLIALISGVITSGAFIVAFLAALVPLVGGESLIWLIGLFGAGIGFSAKPFIGDYMTGVMFILETDFDVGEKVEIVGTEGVVEEINLRTTRLRGEDGEVYIIPNGEIRSVRNFSRGRFTPVRVKLRVPSSQLTYCVTLLEEMGDAAMVDLPNLLEPWRVITDDVTMSETTDLTLVTKAKFGAGAELRPRVLAYVQERLEQAGVFETDEQAAPATKETQ